jgi:SpoVK/Ycf46/Vps4 family AAA+-type ATPase
MKKYTFDIEKIINLIDPLIRLQKLIGMGSIKTHILNMILYFIQGFETSSSDMLHTSIEGPPGVGKTRLGKILALIYNALGLIPSKRFKRVRRTDLIGKYLGHTAHKTQEVLDEADGGVLFIDEAYSLGNPGKDDMYSKECIDTINMNLTEKKKNLILIIAGYTDQLDKSFFATNEGLKRRFPFRFNIDGYSAKELKEIFFTQIRKINWRLHPELSESYLENFFTQNKEFLQNYGGDIETIILNCKIIHARRVIGLNTKCIITKEDFKNAFDKFKQTKNFNENNSYKMLYS